MTLHLLRKEKTAPTQTVGSKEHHYTVSLTDKIDYEELLTLVQKAEKVILW